MPCSFFRDGARSATIVVGIPERKPASNEATTAYALMGGRRDGGRQGGDNADRAESVIQATALF